MKSLLWLSMIWFVGISSCLWGFLDIWQNLDENFPIGTEYQKDPNANLGEQVTIKEEGSIINRLLKVFNLDRVSQGDDHKFLNYVKAILNVALWLLSMVALIMTIYTFYLMFFTENDAGIKKAKWNLVGIFIALAIVWLSWLIVSFIFWWYQSQWQNRQWEIQSNNITMANYESNNQIYLTV